MNELIDFIWMLVGMVFGGFLYFIIEDHFDK